MRSAEYHDEAALIHRVCRAWQALLRHAVAAIRPPTVAALADHLAKSAERISGVAILAVAESPAPENGFYFCLRCLSYHPHSPEIAAIEHQDDLSDYEPIFQVAGMISPRCKRCASNALWIGPTGLGRLAVALSYAKLSDVHVKDHDLPMAATDVVDSGASPAPPAPSGTQVVYPQLVVGHVIRFRCPVCGKHLSAKHSEAGRNFACPNCQAPVVTEGDLQAKIQIKLQCPLCQARMKLRARQIGAPIACGGCPATLFPMRHRLARAPSRAPAKPAASVTEPDPAAGLTSLAGEAGASSDTSALAGSTMTAVTADAAPQPPPAEPAPDGQLQRLRDELAAAERHLLERDRILTRQQAEIETLKSQLESVSAGQRFRGLAMLFDTLLQREDEIAELRKKLFDKEEELLAAQERLVRAAEQTAGVASMLSTIAPALASVR